MGSLSCDSCNRQFNTSQACDQHMTALGHWIWRYECETCTARFKTQQSTDQHMEMKDHWHYPYECETCSFIFRTEHGRDEHQAEERHYKHLHCTSCDRYFQSEANLRQHMNSKTHRGTDIVCPFCDFRFTTASGVSHHLESSACSKAPFLNRTAIHRGLRQRDPDGIVTERLLQWHESPSDIQWDPRRCWNGANYECYVCRRQFKTAQSIQQHIESPAHQAPLYHCPNKRGPCGGKQFPTLAALFNHLESESCGYIKFDAVQKNINGFLAAGNRSMITM